MAKRFGTAGNQVVQTRSGGEAEKLGLGRAFALDTRLVSLNSADGVQAILVIVNSTSWGLAIDEINASSIALSEVTWQVVYNPSSHAAPVPLVPLSLNRMKPEVFKGVAFRSSGAPQAAPFGGTIISTSVTKLRTSIYERDGIILAPNDSLMVQGSAAIAAGLVSVSLTCHHI